MSYYDHPKFVHPVPAGYTIPAGTPVRLVNTSPHQEETFFVPRADFMAPEPRYGKFFLDYDITRPTLPDEINSVIYNVHSNGGEYPVAVYQGSRIWSAFSELGERTSIYTPEIESFDTTPPLADRYAANEAKQREAAES